MGEEGPSAGEGGEEEHGAEIEGEVLSCGVSAGFSNSIHHVPLMILRQAKGTLKVSLTPKRLVHKALAEPKFRV